MPEREHHEISAQEGPPSADQIVANILPQQEAPKPSTKSRRAFKGNRRSSGPAISNRNLFRGAGENASPFLTRPLAESVTRL